MGVCYLLEHDYTFYQRMPVCVPAFWKMKSLSNKDQMAMNPGG